MMSHNSQNHAPEKETAKRNNIFYLLLSRRHTPQSNCLLRAPQRGGHQFVIMKIRSFASTIVLATSVQGFVPTNPSPFTFSTKLGVTFSCQAPKEGEIIVDDELSPVLVTKVAGTFYAIDAKCPHLGLSMKHGTISCEGGVPTLTCSHHSSCFELETGRCTQWATVSN